MEDWKRARTEVLERLGIVRGYVLSKNEAGVVELANQQDSFCQEARKRRAGAAAPTAERHCHFCEGYIQSGGCEERLSALNRAVLTGDWTVAERVIDGYISWVESLSVGS